MSFFKRVKNRKGQALVEMALSLLIMLNIMLGIAEFGWLFKSYIVVTNASREAARIAAVDNNYAAVKTKVEANYPGITITKPYLDGAGNVNAVASQDYETITPIVGDLIKAAWDGKIEVKTIMKSET